ncbi:hypothetical protein BDK51DRAFT_34251, partial [Blyttiomyces helicus]
SGIVHRDAKPEPSISHISHPPPRSQKPQFQNIIITGTSRSIRPIPPDFRFAGPYDCNTQKRVWMGTLAYASPEILNFIPYSGPEIDVWIFGATIYTFVFGGFPFASVSGDMSVVREDQLDFHFPASIPISTGSSGGSNATEVGGSGAIAAGGALAAAPGEATGPTDVAFDTDIESDTIDLLTQEYNTTKVTAPKIRSKVACAPPRVSDATDRPIFVGDEVAVAYPLLPESAIVGTVLHIHEQWIFIGSLMYVSDKQGLPTDWGPISNGAYVGDLVFLSPMEAGIVTDVHLRTLTLLSREGVVKIACVDDVRTKRSAASSSTLDSSGHSFSAGDEVLFSNPSAPDHIALGTHVHGNIVFFGSVSVVENVGICVAEADSLNVF